MPYSKQTVERIWEKGRVIPEQDPAVWRKDECGAWIQHTHYGREDSEYGWKIANISPGGADVPENLRPFHCRNSYNLGTGRAHCHVTADQKSVDSHEHLVSSPHNRSVGSVSGQTV